jgi:hypothetical protein
MIPNESHTAAIFADFADFAEQLWAETSYDMRGDCLNSYELAQACMLSENGVFVTFTLPDGRLLVEYVG